MFKQHDSQNQIGRNAQGLSASAGNTLTEYAILGILLLVVSFGALQVLGSNFNAAMAMIKSEASTKSGTATAAWVAHNAAATGKTPTLTAEEQAILQESLTSKLQTTGANGATEVLAKQLAAAAEQLLKDGKIDKSQYDLLMKLSNEGHKMAQMQGMIADAMKFANGDVAAFSNMKFTIDGQSYTAPELAEMIGFNGPSPATFGPTDILSTPSGGTTGTEVGNFLDLYNQALASGALADPLAKTTVDSASTQIASLGELTEDTIWNVNNNGMPMDAANITTLTSQSSTEMNSSKICSAGSYVDNGALCSP
jgi:hypothetical protein